MRTLFTFGLILGLAVPATALGHGKGDDAASPSFQRMDSDADGRISADEHAAAAKKMFATMDADQDGKVTADEMTAAHEKVVGKKAEPGEMSAADKIKVIDKDGDGVLTAEEHAEGSKTMFGKMDENKDGYLSRAELDKGHATMMKKK